MSDSQKFPVAAHALAYLAHKDAMTPQGAVSSAELAGSMPTNPVVVRRVTGLLSKAGLVATRSGANGGTWLLKAAEDIGLDEVLKAVDGCAHLGAATKGAAGCPVGEMIPDRIREALVAADLAVRDRLSGITVADLLKAR